MQKYWEKQIFSLGSLLDVGQKQKTEKERKKERLNDGNNNGQLRIARKAVWANSPGIDSSKLCGDPCKTGSVLYIRIIRPCGQFFADT